MSLIATIIQGGETGRWLITGFETLVGRTWARGVDALDH
jgi:hypothetical protein